MLQLRGKYECADEQTVYGKETRKKGARHQRQLEALERQQVQRNARELYEADLQLMKEEAGVSDELWLRLRRHCEAPPARVIGKFLIYDAVALARLVILRTAVVDAVGRALAMRGGGGDARPRAPRQNRARRGVVQTGRGGNAYHFIAALEGQAKDDAEKAEVAAAKKADATAAKATRLAGRAQASTDKAAAAQQSRQAKELQEATVLESRAIAVLAAMQTKNNWNFARQPRTRRLLLVRWMGGRAAKVPSSDGIDDDHFLSEWDRVKPAADLEDVRRAVLVIWVGRAGCSRDGPAPSR